MNKSTAQYFNSCNNKHCERQDNDLIDHPCGDFLQWRDLQQEYTKHVPAGVRRNDTSWIKNSNKNKNDYAANAFIEKPKDSTIKEDKIQYQDMTGPTEEEPSLNDSFLLLEEHKETTKDGEYGTNSAAEHAGEEITVADSETTISQEEKDESNGSVKKTDEVKTKSKKEKKVKKKKSKKEKDVKKKEKKTKKVKKDDKDTKNKKKESKISTDNKKECAILKEETKASNKIIVNQNKELVDEYSSKECNVKPLIVSSSSSPPPVKEVEIFCDMKKNDDQVHCQDDNTLLNSSVSSICSDDYIEAVFSKKVPIKKEPTERRRSSIMDNVDFFNTLSCLNALEEETATKMHNSMPTSSCLQIHDCASLRPTDYLSLPPGAVHAPRRKLRLDNSWQKNS